MTGPGHPFSDAPEPAHGPQEPSGTSGTGSTLPGALEPRTRGGRPTRLTRETHDAIVSAIEQGAYVKVAAQAAGVGASTLAGWLARGREAAAARDAGAEPSDDDAPYLELLESVTRGQAQAELDAVAAWRKAWRDDWRAARDYLARTAPERWAGVTRVQMTTEEAERRIDDAVNEALLSVGVNLPGADPLDGVRDGDL